MHDKQELIKCEQCGTADTPHFIPWELAAGKLCKACYAGFIEYPPQYILDARISPEERKRRLEDGRLKAKETRSKNRQLKLEREHKKR